MVYIIIGVSGIGKTTIGKMLANTLGIPFYDADDYHPPSNIKKLTEGIPLNDTDRYPWLQILSRSISLWQKKRGAVLACSALKEKYRKILGNDGTNTTYIFLNADISIISERLKNRKKHFFKPNVVGISIQRFRNSNVRNYH